MNLLSSTRRLPVRALLLPFLMLALAGAPLAAHAQKAAAAGKKGASGSGGKGRLPAEDELKDLVRKTLLDVDKGLETKDFSQLYASLSPTWRKQISKDQLSLLFARQLDEEQRTDYAAKNDVVFDPAPVIDPQGLLVLSGQVPSVPQSIVFRLKFRNEGGFKPFGIAVRVQNAERAPSRLPLAGEKEESLPIGKGAAAAAAAAASATPPPPTAPPGTTPSGYVSPFGAPATPAAPAAGGSPVTPAPSPSASPSR